MVGAAALEAIVLADMQSWDSKSIPFYSKAECGSSSGNDTGGGGCRDISAAAGHGSSLYAASSPSSIGAMAASSVENAYDGAYPNLGGVSGCRG
jgi:hypothetical protein